MNFANDVLDAIEIMVKQVVEDNVTKIYTGVCKTTGANNCVLTINGKDNTVKYYGGVPVVGTVYQVFIPFGNMSAAFIIVPGSGGGSGGSGVDSVNGKTGDVVLNAADVGALPNTTVIPSKTSQLTNDSGYITVSGAPVKSVDGATGDVVTNAIKTTQQNLSDAQKTQARINIGAGTSSFDGNYSSLSGKPTIPSNTSQLNNDSGFITSESAPVKSVNSKAGEVVLSASDVGAVSKTGDTMTGNLTISKSDYPDLNIENTGSNSSTKIRNSAHQTQIMCMEDSNNYRMLTLHDESATTDPSNILQITQVEDGNQTASYKVYHTGYNPTSADVGLGNVDNIKQYSEINPPPYPVVSVNGKTGGVNLVASDVGAVPTDNITQTLGTSTTKVPSEKAVTDAIAVAGGGDMLKSVYDATGAIANGGGIADYIKTNSFTFLGTNPISSTSDDTTANWATLGAGYARYNTAGLLINQPSRYGFVINYEKSGDIFQIWNSQASGPMYYRCGNNSGWSKSWTKILDATDLIVSNTQPSGQAVGGFWYQIT